MTVKLVAQDTPEKFRSTAEEAAQTLTALLRELAAMENKSFAQYTRLCKKGQVIEFKDGVRREFTDIQDWKEEMKRRFAALLAPHCTQKLIAQRRDCLHAEHFPSSFNCVNTGCTLSVTGCALSGGGRETRRAQRSILQLFSKIPLCPQTRGGGVAH